MDPSWSSEKYSHINELVNSDLFFPVRVTDVKGMIRRLAIILKCIISDALLLDSELQKRIIALTVGFDYGLSASVHER